MFFRLNIPFVPRRQAEINLPVPQGLCERARLPTHVPSVLAVPVQGWKGGGGTRNPPKTRRGDFVGRWLWRRMARTRPASRDGMRGRRVVRGRGLAAAPGGSASVRSDPSERFLRAPLPYNASGRSHKLPGFQRG